MGTTKTPHQQLGGARHKRTVRRDKASQARLDAILDAVGNDPDALRKLLCAIAEIASSENVINR